MIPIEKNILICLDNVLVHFSDVDTTLRNPEFEFRFCTKNRIRLNNNIHQVFNRKARLRRRIISQDGIRFDQNRLN